MGCSNCVDKTCDRSYDNTFKLGKNDFNLMKTYIDKIN